jgi:hypothetical protein
MAYSSVKGAVGNATNPFTLSLANRNYTTRYFKPTHASGDIRGFYDKLFFYGAGGGEVYRAVAEASKPGSAAGATLNAAHFTGRVGSVGSVNGTVSGALNAVRATLEVAGTTPTPGGTLSAIQLDSNIVTGATMGTKDAFIRVTQSGAVNLNRLLNLPAPVSADSASLFVASADKAATHMVRCVSDAGVTYWMLATTNAPS